MSGPSKWEAEFEYKEYDRRIAALQEDINALTKERDAYKKAKQENDDRFMAERDEARAEVAHWKVVTGFDDPESLDMYLGRMPIMRHTEVQADIIAKAHQRARLAEESVAGLVKAADDHLGMAHDQARLASEAQTKYLQVIESDQCAKHKCNLIKICPECLPAVYLILSKQVDVPSLARDLASVERQRDALANEADQYKKLLAEDSPLMEKLAHIEHARWAGWMEYLFSKCCIDPVTGGATIPLALTERWERQVKTLYEQLSEKEKESDRVEVRKTLACLREGWVDPNKE